jgi:GDP-4-dehydro-6-deoxy-D-mannose reductase
MADIVVTGAAGFLGAHLVAELTAHRHQVVGVDFGAPPAFHRGEWVSVSDSTDLARAVDAGVALRGASAVVHCAFVNRKPAAQTEETYLAEAASRDLPVLRCCARGGLKLLLVSSSAVYGNLSFRDRALREDDPLRPVTLYGVAKAAQELQAGFFAASSGLQLSVARLFNLCGPGQKEGMLIPDWVSRVAAIEAGAEPRLVVRNRATTRDFVDVRDAARALRLMVETFRPGDVVNVASGAAVSLVDLSEALLALSAVPYDVIETDPVPSGTDPLVHCGSYERLHDTYGWAPTIPWRTSLEDIWQQYRRRTKQ